MNDPALLARVEQRASEWEAGFLGNERSICADLRSIIALVRELRLRERRCDAVCGANQHVVERWHAAEAEFQLQEDEPYAAIDSLRTQLAEQAAAYRAHIAALDRAMAVVAQERDGAREAIQMLRRHLSLLAAPGIVAPEVK